MRDLENPLDLRRLVTAFYASVRDDAELGPVFAARIADEDWPEHLETMTRFWSAIVFGMPVYHGEPLVAHRGLTVESRHFARWLSLWAAAVSAQFEGPRARNLIARASRIAGALSHQLGVI